jgi:hypothetical protein
MEHLLREAGFIGIEVLDGVIYARSDPTFPEFTATRVDNIWTLAQTWPLRSTPAQVLDWSTQHPDAPMDIHQGETRITLRATPDNLKLWGNLTQTMVSQCIVWRRETRQRDEGM